MKLETFNNLKMFDADADVRNAYAILEKAYEMLQRDFPTHQVITSNTPSAAKQFANLDSEITVGKWWKATMTQFTEELKANIETSKLVTAALSIECDLMEKLDLHLRGRTNVVAVEALGLAQLLGEQRALRECLEMKMAKFDKRLAAFNAIEAELEKIAPHLSGVVPNLTKGTHLVGALSPDVPLDKALLTTDSRGNLKIVNSDDFEIGGGLPTPQPDGTTTLGPIYHAKSRR